MKIVSTGSALSSPEFHAKKKKARKRRLYFWCAGFTLLVAGLIFLSRQEKFLIAEVNIEGAKTVSKESIEASVRQWLSGYYFWVIPRANFFLYSGSEIKTGLLKEFPRFSSVALDTEGMWALSIAVAEREPFALYCPSALNPEDASACYFLDERGFIFDRAPSFSGSVYFIYALEHPLNEPLGQEFLAPGEFKPVAKFVRDLSNLGFEPLALEVSDDEFRIILPREARLVLRRQSDLDVLYANLQAFLNDESVKTQLDFLERLMLLDLRTENKVFYRFRE